MSELENGNESNENPSNESNNEYNGVVDSGQQYTPQQDSEMMLQAKEDLAALKEHMVSGEATGSQKNQFRELNDFVHFNGKLPSYMEGTPAIDADSIYEPETCEIAKAFEAAKDTSQYKTYFDNMPEDYGPENLQEIKDFALEAAMPPEIGNMFISRFLKHSNDSHTHTGDEDIGQLSDEKQAEFYAAAVNAFGSEEKFKAVGVKAVQYLENTLSAEHFKQIIDRFKNTSLMYDPWMLNAFAAMHDARWSTSEDEQAAIFKNMGLV